MRKNDLSVFKMENNGVKITLKRGADFQPVIHTNSVSTPMTLPLAAMDPLAPAAAPPVAGAKLREITSPMVGTFYSSASPDAQAYVRPGQEIEEDTVVCIVEAMKVMNEIKAECRGTIVDVVAENGKPVQFGQVIFRVQPK
jgi:acetyl-CoA carboxylase biotin carboxyl carrier protein